ILPLETAIRKMTSLPAQMIGMRYRGTLKSKNFADITIFNPETIIDTATYLNPHQYPIGIEYVIVNGVIVINKGEHSGKLPGKVIRHDSNSFS
ncbi:MAG: amidohydrolase family protein, partial [Candidatus Hermodarchaeota archaeon]